MKPRGYPEKRHHRRHLVRLPYRVTATQLSPLGLAGETKRPLRGRIQDISAGGLSVQTSQSVKTPQFVRCEIALSDVPVAIPTLMRVRWYQKDPAGVRHRAGLQFLLH